MSRNVLQKLILSVSIILLVIGLLVGFLVWEVSLLQRRGYTYIGRLSVPPHFLPMLTLSRINDFCKESFRKSAKENIEQSNLKWPDVKSIAANVPEVDLVRDQAYAKFGIYILKAKKNKQLFLYSPNHLMPDSKLIQIENKFQSFRGMCNLVQACVMAMRENPPGEYYAYRDYPLVLKEEFGFDAWKTWYFVTEDYGRAAGTYYVRSDIPPIPGCFAYIDLEEAKSSKFYYHEEILHIFKGIYPNADIPEDQILREGRDY